jgi:hypothetical protein
MERLDPGNSTAVQVARRAGAAHVQALLAAAGRRAAGLAVLRRSADGYRQLGRPANAGQVDALICRIGQGRAADP